MKSIALALLPVLLLSWSPLNWLNGGTAASSFEINYYSVGNADAALVECDGHYMMIDCGDNDIEVTDSSNTYKIDRYLQEKGVTKFDYLVCTHPDDDHYSGFTDILEGDGQSRTFGTFYCSTKPNESTTKQFQKFCNSVQSATKRIKVPKEGKKFKLGSANVEVLAVNEGKTSNDSSIVLMITYGENKFLFTGDAEIKTERYLLKNNKQIKCDVLKVAHHGSATSSSDDFLNKADPDYAVISVGNDNEYNLPSGDVLDRLESRDIQVFRTDNGTIVCTSDGSNITIDYRK